MNSTKTKVAEKSKDFMYNARVHAISSSVVVYQSPWLLTSRWDSSVRGQRVRAKHGCVQAREDKTNFKTTEWDVFSILSLVSLQLAAKSPPPGYG